WRFPLRNRIIAGLGRVVVVVESHARGGSRHTVDAAIDRGVDVMAVPGSVRSPSSAGTNELLAAGAAPARDATDVLVALGLATAGNGRPSPPVTTPPPEDHDAVVVLDALGWEPATVGQVADRAGLPLASASVTLVHLERDGWVARRGPWWERRPSTH